MWTLPNSLTMVRIFVIPLLVWAFFLEDLTLGSWIATITFFFAGISDFFDGYLARSSGNVSKIGQFLDPIADKLMVAAVLIMVVAMQWIQGIHVIAAVIIMSREILISGLREYLGGQNVEVKVSMIAKWKTAVQMLALGGLCGIHAGIQIGFPSYEIGIVLLWIATALTVYTGYDYLKAGLKHMVEK